MEQLLQTLLQQESDLEFSLFNHDTAWKIGSWLQQRAHAPSGRIVVASPDLVNNHAGAVSRD